MVRITHYLPEPKVTVSATSTTQEKGFPQRLPFTFNSAFPKWKSNGTVHM
jgi:hypothetical protein